MPHPDPLVGHQTRYETHLLLSASVFSTLPNRQTSLAGSPCHRERWSSTNSEAFGFAAENPHLRHNGGEVLRGIVNSLLSLLIVATFLWGGCVSCERYFMFPGEHPSCCDKPGQCERRGKTPPKPEKQDCNRLPLDRRGNAHALPLPAVLPVIAAPLLHQIPTLIPVRELESRIEPSPPDIQALNVTFLI